MVEKHRKTFVKLTTDKLLNIIGNVKKTAAKTFSILTSRNVAKIAFCSYFGCLSLHLQLPSDNDVYININSIAVLFSVNKFGPVVVN